MLSSYSRRILPDRQALYRLSPGPVADMVGGLSKKQCGEEDTRGARTARDKPNHPACPGSALRTARRLPIRHGQGVAALDVEIDDPLTMIPPMIRGTGRVVAGRRVLMPGHGRRHFLQIAFRVGLDFSLALVRTEIIRFRPVLAHLALRLGFAL